jgi:hypothetical protein
MFSRNLLGKNPTFFLLSLMSLVFYFQRGWSQTHDKTLSKSFRDPIDINKQRELIWRKLLSENDPITARIKFRKEDANLLIQYIEMSTRVWDSSSLVFDLRLPPEAISVMVGFRKKILALEKCLNQNDGYCIDLRWLHQLGYGFNSEFKGRGFSNVIEGRLGLNRISGSELLLVLAHELTHLSDEELRMLRSPTRAQTIDQLIFTPRQNWSPAHTEGYLRDLFLDEPFRNGLLEYRPRVNACLVFKSLVITGKIERESFPIEDRTRYNKVLLEKESCSTLALREIYERFGTFRTRWLPSSPEHLLLKQFTLRWINSKTPGFEKIDAQTIANYFSIDQEH